MSELEPKHHCIALRRSAMKQPFRCYWMLELVSTRKTSMETLRWHGQVGIYARDPFCGYCAMGSIEPEGAIVETAKALQKTTGTEKSPNRPLGGVPVNSVGASDYQGPRTG